MKIVNVEKLDGRRRIVITGRDKHIRRIANHLPAKLYYCPRVEDHFTDYPIIIKELQEMVAHEKGIVAITTQSKEFLDCLLQSDFDFVLVTVRQYGSDDADTYRLRVLTKEEAWKNRCAFNFEMRV